MVDRNEQLARELIELIQSDEITIEGNQVRLSDSEGNSATISPLDSPEEQTQIVLSKISRRRPRPSLSVVADVIWAIPSTLETPIEECFCQRWGFRQDTCECVQGCFDNATSDVVLHYFSLGDCLAGADRDDRILCIEYTETVLAIQNTTSNTDNSSTIGLQEERFYRIERTVRPGVQPVVSYNAGLTFDDPPELVTINVSGNIETGGATASASTALPVTTTAGVIDQSDVDAVEAACEGNMPRLEFADGIAEAFYPFEFANHTEPTPGEYRSEIFLNYDQLIARQWFQHKLTDNIPAVAAGFPLEDNFEAFPIDYEHFVIVRKRPLSDDSWLYYYRPGTRKDLEIPGIFLAELPRVEPQRVYMTRIKGVGGADDRTQIHFKWGFRSPDPGGDPNEFNSFGVGEWWKSFGFTYEIDADGNATLIDSFSLDFNDTPPPGSVIDDNWQTPYLFTWESPDAEREDFTDCLAIIQPEIFDLRVEDNNRLLDNAIAHIGNFNEDDPRIFETDETVLYSVEGGGGDVPADRIILVQDADIEFRVIAGKREEPAPEFVFCDITKNTRRKFTIKQLDPVPPNPFDAYVKGISAVNT